MVCIHVHNSISQNSRKVDITHVPTDGATDKQNVAYIYIHTTEYFSALKSKEILIHVTTWMNHDDVMLSKINRHKRTNIVYFDLYEVPRVVKFIEMESRMVAVRV